jgi:clan AA aspartic protease (TIGR02281 family)
MRCPKCLTENDRSSPSCRECGTPLRAVRPVRSVPASRIAFILIGILLVVCLFLVYRFVLSPDNQAEPLAADSAAASAAVEDAPPRDSSQPSSAPSLITGRAVIRDSLGKEVGSMEAAVVAGSWIALPVWAGLGGARWTFYTADMQEIPVTEGSWRQGSPLGFWKLEREAAGETYPLAPWKKEFPLRWRSLDPSKSHRTVHPASQVRQGLFVRFPVPGELDDVGVFVQNNRIVGWTFGQRWDTGFLWAGEEDPEFSANISIRDLVGVAFREAREAQFAQALGLGPDVPVLQRLEALAEGFRLTPRLNDKDKPPSLQRESVLTQIRSLARERLRLKDVQDMIEILDSEVVGASRDPELLKIMTQAWEEAYDYRRALRFFESAQASFVAEPDHVQSTLRNHRLQLYKQWIQADIDQELIGQGWEAFDIAQQAFPDDLELHFLGVELAILGREWTRAQDLLASRSYPQLYKQRASNLEVILLERKSEAGKITVRFPSGSREIPLDVLLNKRVLQRFIVDTGATVVCIPPETVEALGIVIDDDTPVHRVSTAAGYGYAHEVEINQMELKGYRVHNVKALVIELPGQEGVGLLGQNFLKYFQVEIDSKKGILRLSRK